MIALVPELLRNQWRQVLLENFGMSSVTSQECETRLLYFNFKMGNALTKVLKSNWSRFQEIGWLVVRQAASADRESRKCPRPCRGTLAKWPPRAGMMGRHDSARRRRYVVIATRGRKKIRGPEEGKGGDGKLWKTRRKRGKVKEEKWGQSHLNSKVGTLFYKDKVAFIVDFTEKYSEVFDVFFHSIPLLIIRGVFSMFPDILSAW